MKSFTLILLISLFYAQSAFATQDKGKVKSVYVFKSSYGITLSSGFKNAEAEYKCAPTHGFARIPVEGNNNTKEMYAALLAAHAASHTVRINTDGCMGGHFKISGIYVQKD